MDTNEIVIKKMQRHCAPIVSIFSENAFHESRQSTRVHPNIQIVSLGEGCADYLGSGLLSIRCFTAPMHSAGL
jgi:hypothetical protein